MTVQPRRPFFKSLLLAAFLTLPIQVSPAVAEEGESQAVLVPDPRQPQDAEQTPQGMAPETGGGVLNPFGIPPTMSVAEFKQHMEGAAEATLTLGGFVALREREPDLVVLDVRAPQSFESQRIKGSVNLPLTEMTEHTLPALLPDRARPVVIVCNESFGPTRMISMTLQAWPVLKANGYTRVYRLSLWRPETNDGTMHRQEDIEKYVPLEGRLHPPAPLQNP